MHVLVISASGERDDVLRAIKAGAKGYLVKSATPEELLDGVRKTADGDAVFTATLAGLVLGEFRRMANNPARHDDSPILTTRETEVLRRVAKGMAYREIAELLFVATEPCRTMCRTCCANSSCTTASSSRGTRLSRAWTPETVTDPDIGHDGLSLAACLS